LQDSFQRPLQHNGLFSQLLEVFRTELLQQPFPAGRELQQDFPPVTTVVPPSQIAPLGKTFYQLDCAVVPDM
jgi:hypothetical protein